MQQKLSQLHQFLKKHLSPSSIKVMVYGLYRKTSDMVKRVAKRDDTRAYAGFTSSIFKRLLLAISAAWGTFVTVLAFKDFGQGLSLLIEGWSGTMTIEFAASWLVLATRIAAVVFAGLFVVAIYASVCDFVTIRRKLKASTSIKIIEEFVTKTTFEQFKSGAKDEMVSINKRLDNIERLLSTLVEKQQREKEK